jgi:Rod binding domain-containing protein
MTKILPPAFPTPTTLRPPVPSTRLGPSGPADLTKIAKAAQDFEAMAIGQLLQPMFDTVDTAHGAFGGGDGEEAWKPMLVQEIAKQIAKSGGLGLAKPVYDAMLRMQEDQSK